jgi:nucleoside-diphosphate-sugar epimerase
MTRVLVTGATGFVARSLLPLLSERGYCVRGAIRRPDAVLPPDVEPVAIGDIGPQTDWRAALTGVDMVIHLAARVHIRHDRAADPLTEFRRTNAAGTRCLAEAAAAAGCRRLVFVSSIKALGEETRQYAPMTDRNLPRPLTPYGVSKREAEDHLDTVASRTGLEIVTLRPPLIYGPGVGGNFLSLLRLCWSGIPLPLAAVENRRSLLYVGNLADAIERCMTVPGLAGRRFLIHDGEPLSTPELIRRLAAALGKPARLFKVSPEWLNRGAALAGFADAWTRLTGSLELDDASFRAAAGWQPSLKTDDGLRCAAEWFKASYTRG